MLTEEKRKNLLDLSKNKEIMAVRAWKRRSKNISVVIDAEINANVLEVFKAIKMVLGDVKFDWLRSNQKKNYIQDEYLYKGDGFEVNVVFMSDIKKAV